MNQEFFAARRSGYLTQLEEFLCIPSVSTLPQHAQDMRDAAEFTASALRQAGLLSVRLIEGDGYPLVYGEWCGAPGRPTLLLYGHYDVQPAEPLEEWIAPPFTPAIRNGNIYARGAADDKGQTLILVHAVSALLEACGCLPVNVRFLIEGEEESGGQVLEQYVSAHHAELAADAALICDTEMFAPELPTICVGLRGILYGELHVQGAAQDLHSGVYGGAAPNPLQAVAEIICALKDREGRIQIPGFYDGIQPPAPAERATWAALPFDEKTYLYTEVKAPCLTGEPGVPVLERVWARPTLEVHGIRGGFIGEGAKTVIPARAVAKISCRLVPDQQPDRIAKLLEDAISDATPLGVTATWKTLHGAPASVVDPSSPYIQTAARALEQVFHRETAYVRSGGSIPVVGLFQRELGIPSVLMGFGLPDDNIHAPNEKLYLPNYYRGIEAVARYLELLGG